MVRWQKPVPSPWAQGHGGVAVSVKEDRTIVAFSRTVTDQVRTSRSLADTVCFLVSFLSALPDSRLPSFLPSDLYNPRLLSSSFPSRKDGRLHGTREWDSGALVMGQGNPGCTGRENGTVEPW